MNKLCVLLLAACCSAGAVALAAASAPDPFVQVADVKVEKKTLKKPGSRKPVPSSSAIPYMSKRPDIKADHSAQTRIAGPVAHSSPKILH